MKRILQTLALCIGLSTTTMAQYRNYSPSQEIMDSLYTQLFTPVQPMHNLLFDKALHLGSFSYADGDFNTDTLDIDDVLQNYTEVIDMNTNGIAGYEQFVPEDDIDSTVNARNDLYKRNSIVLLNYKYSMLQDTFMYTMQLVDTLGGLYKPGIGYYAEPSNASLIYGQSRLMCASVGFNVYNPNQPLWLDTAMYYGNDSYTNYTPVVNLGSGYVAHSWNDTIHLSYTDTLRHIIQIGLVSCVTKDGVQKCDTLYSNTVVRKRKHETYYVQPGGAVAQLPTLDPKPLSTYTANGKVCGIPHEQPVEIVADTVNQYANIGYFTISYGKDASGNRRTELLKPVILVDGVDFGTKTKWNGWNTHLNQCGGTGYFSLKKGFALDYDGKEEFFVVGTDKYNPNSNTNPYVYVSRNVPGLVDSLNQQGYDFIFLDFYYGADDMRRNSAVVRKLLDIINTKMCNSVGHNCPRIMDDITIAGASMGGQVVRHALTYMEYNKTPHHTKQYVAFDSPNLGANVPIGLQAMANNVEFYNALWLKQFKDLVKRKLSRQAAKQLLLMHYPRPNYKIAHANATGNESIERTTFYAELAAMGNWPKQCEKIAIANGSSNGTTIPDFAGGDLITDVRLDYNQLLTKLQNNVHKQCSKVKGINKVGQSLKCAGWYVARNFVNLLFAHLTFSASAYCPDGNAGCTIARVDPLTPAWKKHIKLNTARAILDNAPGSGNDALADSKVNFKYGISASTAPGYFFTFIPTTSALALNTQGVPDFKIKDFSGNETDRVDNHIIFDYVQFNKPHPNVTVFDRVFFNEDKNEQHVEVTFNGGDKKLSKITQFMHIVRTGAPYAFVPTLRTLGYATGTNVMHYNFDTLVSETGKRKSDITNNVQQPVAIGAHIINKNGYLGINEYAPPSLFDTKASNSYVYANLPLTTALNKGNNQLQLRNWQNQAYQIYGCSYITVNNLGKWVIGDKDSTIRYKANTTVKEQANVTLNQGGTLTINDNSTLTFEKGSYFNYNGGNIILNGDNARIVVKAGANVTLAQGTTFTVTGGSKGLGRIVFQGDDNNKGISVRSGGQNKLKLKGKSAVTPATGFKTLVEINDCSVNFEVDSTDLKTMEIDFSGTDAKLTLQRTAFSASQLHLTGVSKDVSRGIEIQEPKMVLANYCKANNLINGFAIIGNPKLPPVTSKFFRATITKCGYGIYQYSGGLDVSYSSITETGFGIYLHFATLNNTFKNNTIANTINVGGEGIVTNNTQVANNMFVNNTIDGFDVGINIIGANKCVFRCNTIKNNTTGVASNGVNSIIAQANALNDITYSGYNKFSNNLYHMQFYTTSNLFIDQGYNTFGALKTGGKVFKGFLNPVSKSNINDANYNKWSVGVNANVATFQNQFDLKLQYSQTTIIQILDNNRQANATSCGAMDPPPCTTCRLACTNCTPITTASFANVASNVATDSVITAITDTARTNTNYVTVASQGSQVVNYNYPSTSSVREKQLVQQAHKYQQLAHAMAISTGQLATSSNYATPTTSVTIVDIETALATAQTQGDSQTVASEHLSKVQALYIAQQYTQALSYVTTIKPSIHAGWLQHLNYWECVVQNAYALSTGAIDFETYTLQTNNCNGAATIRKRGSGTTAITNDTEGFDSAPQSVQENDVLLIHPNPVSAGTTLTVTGEGINKLTLYSSQSVKVMEYTTNISDTEASRTSANDRKVLEFTAPNTAGVYWLQVDYNNSVPKRYKVVVQ